MAKFEVILTRNEIDYINSCLSFCVGQCFSLGNIDLGTCYLELHDKLQNLVI